MSCSLLQCAVRRYLAMRTFTRKLLENVSATMLQTHWRASKASREFLRIQHSATVLQAFFRGVRVREIVSIRTSSAVLLQRAWRCVVNRARYAAEMQSIVLVQAMVRSWSVRLQLASQESAAIIIQSKWRSYSACSSYQRKLDLTVAIQSIYRGLQVRRELQFLGACASAMQATWRRYWAELQYQVDLVDIILVQSAIRRRKAVVERKRRETAVLVMQCFVRMSIARKTVQRLRDDDVEHKQQQDASICIQVKTMTDVTIDSAFGCVCTHLLAILYCIRVSHAATLPFDIERSWCALLSSAKQLQGDIWFRNKPTLIQLVQLLFKERGVVSRPTSSTLLQEATSFSCRHCFDAEQQSLLAIVVWDPLSTYKPPLDAGWLLFK